MAPRSSRLVMLAALVCLPALGQSARPDLDAQRLRTGSCLYRTVIDGKDAGQSRIELRRQATQDFIFTNAVFGAFSQSWEAVCTRAFRPVSARLLTGQGAAARVVFELLYVDDRVTGFALTRGGGRSERRAVEEAIAEDTVDQRIDWAAVMAVPEYVSGGRFLFHVYDPNTGNSRLSARVLGFETAAVAAGTFDTAHIEYRIDKSRGPETYEVWVTREPPRFLVRERFPNGAVTELSKMEP